jgi:hypothetical protein
MARVRSPNYPLVSLPEAISKVTAFYQAEQHLAAPKEVVAKHIGYASYHSLAARMISAIEKYGLLEETGGDKVKVSTLAMSILYPKTAEEKQKAINEAAFTPTLFAAIRDEWQGSMPSEQNLRVYLVRRKFASDALDKVIQIYRETMTLVTSPGGGYVSSNGARDEGSPQERKQVQLHAHTPRSGHLVAQPSIPVLAHADSQDPFKVTFTGSSIEIVGRIVSEGDADALIKAVTALKILLQSPSRVENPENPQMQDDED